MLKKVRLGSAEEEEEKEAAALRREQIGLADRFHEWTAALLLIALMAILLMKPAELSLLDAFKFSPGQGSFFAELSPRELHSALYLTTRASTRASMPLVIHRRGEP